MLMVDIGRSAIRFDSLVFGAQPQPQPQNQQTARANQSPQRLVVSNYAKTNDLRSTPDAANSFVSFKLPHTQPPASEAEGGNEQGVNFVRMQHKNWGCCYGNEHTYWLSMRRRLRLRLRCQQQLPGR